MSFDLQSKFFKNLPGDFVMPRDGAERLLFREYGAVFVARGGVIAPSRIVFEDERDVLAFHSRLSIRRARIGDYEFELQEAAMDELLRAIDEAKGAGLDISARGADSARRNYADTIELWRSRVEPALTHWTELGEIATERAEYIRSLSPYAQVSEVLGLEQRGIYFAKDLSKSIIYSVAPPGASQHLSLLAFDVAEFADRQVREILASHNWYQTVTSDLPHFTYLGMGEEELPGVGLQKVISGDRGFWVPDI